MKSILQQPPPVGENVFLAWLTDEMKLFDVGHLTAGGEFVAADHADLTVPTHWAPLPISGDEEPVPNVIYDESPVFTSAFWARDPVMARSTPHHLDLLARQTGILERRIEQLMEPGDLSVAVKWELKVLVALKSQIELEAVLLRGRSQTERQLINRSPGRNVSASDIGEATAKLEPPAQNAQFVPLTEEEEARARNELYREDFDKEIDSGLDYLEHLMASNEMETFISNLKPWMILYALEEMAEDEVPGERFQMAHAGNEVHNHFKIIAFHRSPKASSLLSELQGDWILQMDRAAAQPKREPRAGDILVNLSSWEIYPITDADLPISS